MDELCAFCQNVKMLREKNHLSRRKMAKMLGLSVRDMMKIEKGILPNRATVETVFRIKKYFGIRAQDQFFSLSADDR